MGVYGTTIITGATPVVNGTSGRILYNNSSAVGEATVTGTLGSVVLSTAPTLTGPVTISEAVGSSGLTITGATQTTSQPALNITQTWNAGAVTFTGVKVNVTSTASAAASLLMDLQVGSASKFNVDKTGTVTAKGTIIAADTGPSVFTYAQQGTSLTGSYWSMYNAGFTVGSNGGYNFTANPTDANPNNADLKLVRDAANTLALRNSTNAQTFRVYNTYTDASNGEWLSMSWSTVSNNMYIRTEKNGTGTARVMHLAHSGNSAAISIGTTVNAAGALSLIGNNLGTATASTGILDISPSGATATSGTLVIASVRPTATPTSTSTLTFIPFKISPTINYSNATPGAGSYEALKIAVTETALPTGTNYLIRASAGAAGTTDKFTVTNGGNGTFAGTLTVTGAVTHTSTLAQNGDLTFGDGINIAANTTTGTKIGTSTSQKLGFYNATPVVQQTTGVATSTFVANTSGIVDDSATFGGYKISQIVKALQVYGLLA